ncbi:PDZ domain-containing protein [bacterium]|nr:PDZ domain-containing protein [candidate division CSSED10-310 bacterium]
MRKHTYVILVPVLTILLCWTLLTDATESQPGTLEYLELFSQCFELVQSRYLEETDPGILAEGAVEGMLLATSPYAALLPKSGSSGLIPAYGPASLGMVLGFRDPMIHVIDLLPGSPAEEKGILPGDVLIRIGDQVTPYLTVDRASRMITGTPGETRTIFIQHHLTGELIEEDIELRSLDIPAPELHISVTEGVRVIRLTGELTASVLDRLTAELSSPDSIRPTILDLRHLNLGSEAIGLKLADIFIEDGHPMLDLCRSDDQIISEFRSEDGQYMSGFPLVVIIDRTSAGPAETCAMALKSTGRAIVTGDPSFGRAVSREIQSLDDTFDVLMVTGFYCGADGHKINESGIEPDVPVVLPVLENIDPYMDTALNQLEMMKDTA